MIQTKLLIIGAGIGQVPLLKRAKAKGIHVTVATIPGDYPCIPLADDVILIDIYDRDSIVKEARKRKITAVISDQNDLMMPTVAYVAEKLCLPGNSFETVMSYCNKNLFRQICEKASVPCPKHVAVDTADYDFSMFTSSLPWIVKPADSQSSIGIKKIEHKKDLRSALILALEKSPTKTAIVEEFFEGREVVCEGFINDGKYYLLQFGDRKYFHLKDIMIPSQTLFPSTLSKKIQDKIITYESALTRLTKPSFAIVHSEYLINETSGDICIVESALRGGGVYISSDIVPLATGIDIDEILLNKALGIEIDVDSVFQKRIDHASAYVCFYLPEGIIHSVSGVEELRALPFVKGLYLDGIEIGRKTLPPTYKGARYGPIIVTGTSRVELENNIQKIQSLLNISVFDGSIISTQVFWS